MMIMNAPPTVKQKQGGFCLAACIMSLDKLWGGNWNQDSKDIEPSGWVKGSQTSKVTWTTVAGTLSGIKSCIDAGNYAIVHISGGHGHWVIAYSASSVTEDGIMVMDPVGGNLITLKKAMAIEKSYVVNEVRKATKRK